MKRAKIRVLVVDDSLFMRTLISDMLNSDSEIEVIDTAKDGQEATKKLSLLEPDCITLDLAMPGWDGLTTLEYVMAHHPVPVIILSAHSKKDADITMKCLNAGAIGFVLKPSGELSLDIERVRHELLEQVKVASAVDIARIKSLISKKPSKPKHKLIAANKIVIIGASTGGPQTLEKILSFLPVNIGVPVVIVQHVPSLFFTESLAEHINKECDLEVKVANDGEEIRAGTVYLAPAGFRMTFESLNENEIRKTGIAISLATAEPNSLSPCVDITMKSAADIFYGNTVGVILTGMGCDGREGMKAIKEAGGKTIVQDESSLIFGMPKAVIDAGCADHVLPAGKIAEAIVEVVSQ